MTYFIDERTLDEIKERADIVSVISNHVDLKKVGSNYKGLCPFHGEKTPSFTVSPQKGIYKCFGCGEGGNVISFVMKIEGLSFPEACKKLADEFGIEIQAKSSFDEARQKKQELMYQMNREAAVYYMNNLVHSKIATSYMEKRGLNPKIMKRFGIGYGKDSWDDLVNHLKSLNYDLEIAHESGLIGKNKSGNYYDHYRNRIIFPIIDQRSRVLGFGARALGDDMPKYLNTSDSPIFYKGNNLYGLNLLRRNEKNEKIILVEGYMDVIALESKGINGAVASLGTALTTNQAGILKKHTDNLYISYDGDKAGIAATKRALEIIHSIDWEAKVVSLPDGIDPDSFININGKFKYEVELKNAINGYNFLINEYKKTLDLNSIEDKADLIRYIGNIIKKIKSPIERELQMKKLSEDFSISLETLKSEIFGVNKNISNKNKPRDLKNTVKRNYTSKDKALIKIFRLMINDDRIYEVVKSRLDEKSIENSELREVYLSIISSLEDNNQIDKGRLLNYLKENYIIDEIVYKELIRETNEFEKSNGKSLATELLDNIEITEDKNIKSEILEKISRLENKRNKSEDENLELKRLLSELMKLNLQ